MAIGFHGTVARAEAQIVSISCVTSSGSVKLSSPGFLDSARAVALKAIKLPDAVMIRKAIQVLCVVGTDDDMEIIQSLLKHMAPEIRVDAQCCLFERRVRKTSDAG
jgi:hypothetical protein